MAKKGSTKSKSAAKFDASMRIVILRGPDQYLTSEYTKRLIDSLKEEYGEIDRYTFDGERVEPAMVLDELRSYGLIQQHKLVIVDAADKFLKVKDEEDEAPLPGQKTARELMERYAAQPVDSATLLLRAPTWRPGRLDKAVAKVGAVIKCDAPTLGKAVSWCMGRCAKRNNCEITQEAASMLVDRVGAELARLDAELGKLAAYVGPEGTIGPDAVREMVGLSREEKAWEIQSAVLSGSSQAAMTMLRELLEVSRQPEQLISWSMTDLLRKLHAASQLIRQGLPGGAIAKQLRLWGPAGDAVLGVARRHEPGDFAQLLRTAIQVDLNNKSGLGKPPRNLEALAVQIADRVGCV